MKRAFGFIFVFIFLAFIVTPVLAVTNSSPSGSCATGACNQTQDGFREQLQENRQSLKELKDQLKETRATIRERIREEGATIAARLQESRKVRIRSFFAHLVRRNQAAINRLQRLIARIESRLDKIEASDETIDTTAIRTEVQTAKDKLAEASTALAEAQTSLEDILSAEDPKTAFADIREIIKGIKGQLIEVHQILVKVIGDIRGLRVGQGKITPTPVGIGTTGGL